MKIDQESDHQYVIEELDDQTIVIKEMMLARLKAQLDEVCYMLEVVVWCVVGAFVNMQIGAQADPA